MKSEDKEDRGNWGGFGFYLWGDWRTIVVLVVLAVLVSISVRSGLTPDQIGTMLGAAVKKVFGMP